MTDPVQIRQLLETYERSLNTSDAELAASLYTNDAVKPRITTTPDSAPDHLCGTAQLGAV